MSTGGTKYLPYFASGEIVKGFNRGSNLGFPTANLSDDAVSALPSDFSTGIYYGWAGLEGVTYKMVMSIGWNPFFKNEKKSMEVHILHEFPGALHGKILKIIVTGFIRNEADFPSMEALIATIKNDVEIARTSLDEPSMAEYQTNEFLLKN